MRSLPNCRIDLDAAERMYQATVKLTPCEDGNRDHGEIIGAYLGWALDEIERQRSTISRLEAAYLEAKYELLKWDEYNEFGPGEKSEDELKQEARESLERIRAGEQG